MLRIDNIMNENKKRFLLTSLEKYYSNSENSFNELVSIINGKSKLSLRLIDWFVCNYSKKYKIVYTLSKDSDSPTQYFVYRGYKSQLKAYSKKLFDPFCRRERTDFTLKGKTITTTIGQLNFFRWALTHNITEYINRNYNKIELDMHNSLKNKKEKKGNKRNILSKDETKKFQKYNSPYEMSFD